MPADSHENDPCQEHKKNRSVKKMLRSTLTTSAASPDNNSWPPDMLKALTSSAQYIVVLTLISMVIGAFCLLLYTLQLSFLDGCRAIGEGLLISGAFFTSGALLGFLFGIPHIENGNRPNNTAELVVKRNSNLEQVSDWLTKLIVGGTLTELRNIPGQILKLAKMFPIFTPSMSVALIIYTSSIGFLASFLITRLYLTPILTEADEEVITIAKGPGTASSASP